jgi:amino acid adenylation domain-containing protein
MSLPQETAVATVEQKRRLLTRLLEKRAARPQSFPLSYSQQRLWFLDQMEPGSPAYLVGEALHLRGTLRVEALAASLREIVRRHKVLRSRFAVHAGEPVQIIDPVVELALPVVDLSGLEPEARQRTMRRLVREDRRTPFDLRRGHLLRSTLLRLAGDHHVILLTGHHIISDGWSIGILLRELGALYPAFCAGRPSPLPRLSLQYVDYVQWQREWLTGEVLAVQIDYWRERLAGVPPLELPGDRPRPAVQTFRGFAVRVSFPPALRDGLVALGRREGATLYMTIAAAFQTLLGRSSGQDDVTVGSPIANRRRRELEDLIGFFSNTIVLRTDLAGNPPFRELLARVREAALGAFAHQDTPLERLVQELQPERDPSRSPLFQALLAVQAAADGGLDLPGLTAELIEAESDTAKFDVTLELGESPRGLVGLFDVNADIFDRTTAQRMLGHFERLLEAIVATPDERIGELPLLWDWERAQLLGEWNAAVVEGWGDGPAPGSLADLFEAHAAAAPGRPAVVHLGETLTYGELDRRAGRLAWRLRGLGVGPDVPVGIFLDRSLEMAVAVLGVIKAGGAYLPLDPAYPADRLAFMIADADVPVLLTRERLAGVLPQTAARVLRMDSGEERAAVEREPAGAPERPADLTANLAYLIYTSGSTGRPKGVAMTHGALLNLLAWQLPRSMVGEAPPRTLQFAALSFDASCQELFATWGSGGALYLIAEELRRDPPALLAALDAWGIERLFLPFVALRQLAEMGLDLGIAPAALREVVTAGETLHVTATVAGWLARLPLRRLDNQYGPTEAHVVTAWELAGDPAGWPALPPIGRPVPNLRAVVLDRRGQAVPIGVPGELCLGGPALARGYRGRPDVTAERFVPDPFSDACGPGERLYRTGDLAHWRTDGSLELLGRADHQVKVRGFRVELGEIEAALGEQPGVRQAVVVVGDDAAGGKTLLAFVVSDLSDRGAAPAAEILRAALRSRLPEHMVPARFAFLDRLPLTPSGKVDRKALAHLQPAAEAGEGSYHPAVPAQPLTPTEELVAGIFADLLQIPAAAPDDSFFDLGGHSLLATRLVARLRAVLGVELPVRAVFEAPAVSELAAAVTQALRAGRPSPAPPLVRMPAEQRSGPIPLSFAQQRLWFLDQLEPESPAYNIATAVRLAGPLDRAAFAAALNEAVRRHEALRTTFYRIAGEPVQVIADSRPEGSPESGPAALPWIDLSGLAPDPAAAEARRLARDEAFRPFDLIAGPLLRVALAVFGESDHLAFLTLHHIIGDGWSLDLLVRELGTVYKAFSRGLPSPLPELPVQYADFAVWQRSWLTGEVLEAEMAWWRGRLAGLPPELELPADRPRPAVRTVRGEDCPFPLAGALLADLRRLSRREGATLFMTLLAAFDALLARSTGEEDFAVGTPVAGRNEVQVEGLIGLFVNTLVLRADLRGDPSFFGLLGRVRETTLGAYAHQDLPFDKLVDELAPERALNRSPLFQAVCALQDAPGRGMSLSGLEMSGWGGGDETAKYDLTLDFLEAADHLAGKLNYSTDLFDRPSIERMLGHLRTLLAAAVEDSGRRLSELPLLSAGERWQAVGEWSWTAAAPPPRPIHELFAEQAERTPEAVAVESAEGRLTYRELDDRAGRLAGRLRALRVGLETPVGILTERSPEMVIGLLGILKAGGAYVPLDPSHPRERLALILEDTGAPVVLAQEHLRDRLPAAVRVVETTCHPEGELCESEGSGRADNLAYILYTSGSTGRPKGVAVPHRAVVRLVRGTGGLRIGPDEIWLQLAPLAFDASTLEIWGPLLNGGRLVLAGPHTPTLEELGRTIARHGVTSLWLTAGLFHQMVESCPEALRPLRKLLAGGDVLSPSHVGRALAALPGTRLINGYGPTENTTFTCCHLLTDPWEAAERVPIGRPVAGTRVYLMDGGWEPVPAGVPGELWTGGEGLGRGYLGRPGLTAERFVPDPFGGPGERLYRTGDRARFRPEGTIEFLGRLDRQVKIRGFRIEPGEIEVALGAYPGLRDVAVVVTGEGADRRLAACYAAPADGPQPSELRRLLSQRVPEPLVPSSFVRLDALPLTAHGKIDRKALARLAALPEGETQPGAPLTAPRTRTEELLAGIFAEVLELPPGRVGVEDDFFARGGHSLLATRLVSRVREAFGVELPLRVVFEAPQLAALAAAVDLARQAAPGLLLPALAPVPRTALLPLSFAQQRLWFLDQLEPGNPAYNIPMAIRLEGELDASALTAALTEIVRRHEGLRTVFVRAGDGEPAQQIQPAGPFPLPVVDLGGLGDFNKAETEARRLAAAEARRPFDLARGPLLRVTRVALGAAESHLLVTLHHIAGDGWSLGVLVRELTALYGAFAAGRPSPLPELPVQYADFALRQRRELAGPALEIELSHWRERLAGSPALDLPVDRPRPLVQTYRGAALAFELPGDLLAAMHAFARRRGATLFMILLTAFQALLSRWSGQSDINVGSPIAGRTRLQTEGLIGLFVNTLVLRTRLDGAPGLAALLDRVRATTLAAYAHQDVPFERIVEELQPKRDLARTPLFQVMLALQNAPFGALELPGLRLELLPVATGTAKFELTLTFTESGGALSVLYGTAEHNRGLFDATTVRRLLGHFGALLRASLADPEQSVLGLPLLGAAERHALLAEWNDIAGPTASSLLLDLFAAQARQRPGAVAVAWGEERLTYAELDRRADILARRLRRLGVGPEVRAGVLLERSPDLVVAQLAVLKAGGAYVPLDPAHPAARLSFLAADAGLAAVVSRGELAARITAAPCPVLDIEAPSACLPSPGNREGGAGRGAGGEGPGAAASHLAYVIYTSGSTGAPKGVAVSHAALGRLIAWHVDEFGVRPGTRTSQLAGLGFDAAASELWPALAAGAEVHLVEDAVRTEPAKLRDWLLARKIEVSFAPTPLAEALLELDWPRRTPLRFLLTGGDRLLGRPRADLPFALINGYGPTEATVVATSGRVEAKAARAERAPGIGRPLPHTEVHLLDAGGQPVPMGVVGELCIGGAGLARGYLGSPERTAERFVPDPFGALKDRPGGRLYRTGDLARWTAGGELAFAGRLDAQVKIRGIRIEPGEIEAALTAHPAVREAAVAVTGDGANRRLAAWYVTRPESPEPSALRQLLAEHLRQRLPEALLPAAFVRLEALPLTPNGKVDRKALVRLGTLEEAAPALKAPRTRVEKRLAGIFAEVLELPVDRISAEDGFFELGGHSLLATRLVVRVREALGVELPLRAVFAAPRVAQLAAIVERLRKAGPGLTPPPLVPVPRTGALPLSFAQQRLWFLDQLDPGSAAYNIPSAVRLTGTLHGGALEAALSTIVRRHEALRTVFGRGADGAPVQTILPAAPFPLPVVDLSGLSDFSRAGEEARRLALEEPRRPFDLARGPLLRILRLTRGAREHDLLMTMHHIVSDGWSMGLFVGELTALYGAFATGRPSPLPELAVQYADFAVWQRRWLSGVVLEAELDHWRERLTGAPPALELPTDRPRPAVQTFRGASVPFTLPGRLVSKLNGFARQRKGTLFMGLLAAFQALLARLSGQEDVSVGSPIAGRTNLHTERLIGFFVNTLVLRTRLDDGPGMGPLLARVRETTVAAYAHQEVPFESLVEMLQPERDLGRTPLFQVMLALQNAPPGALDVPGLHLESVRVTSGTAKFELTVTLSEDGGALRGSAEYNRDLFDAATIRRLVGHLEVLLAAALAEPERSVLDLPLLADAERQALLVEWNDTARGTAPADLLPDLFAAQARQRPEAVALVWQEERITYGALAARVDGLARRLRLFGVGPEVRAGVLLERSPNLVVALLAVLAAGGAYVPLDPAYPRERLAWIAEDAAVALVITQEALLPLAGEIGPSPPAPLPAPPALSPGEGRQEEAFHVAFLPSPGGRVGGAGRGAGGEGPGGGDLDEPLDANNLAYLIYTSGSTGRPKGVAIEHRSAAARVRWAAEAFSPEELAGVLASTSVAFDLSVFEIFAPLCLGGTVYLAANALELPSLPAAGEVTLLNIVPAAAAALAEIPASVRTVSLAGEPLRPELAARLYEHGVERVLNLYGPSEDTTYSTWAIVGRGAARVTIGRPLPGTRVALLDRGFQPVPVGVVGELCLAGAGLARGYFGRPDLTAERFVPDPLETGGRLYRTGDLARWLPGGEIDFLGRLDYQVKVRGFRIEPGEIETALESHPAVREAAVVALGEGTGRRLAAFYAAGGEGAEPAALRDRLRERLPDYMVPSLLVPLDDLPRTPNGKVDRRALIRLAVADERAGSPGRSGELPAAPRTPLEEILVGIFAEVLTVPAVRIGPADNFFERGGHSLLATRLLSRVREALGVELPLRTVFETPTPAGLAEAVERAQRTGLRSRRPPLGKEPRTGPLPLSFAQQRLWVIDRLQPGSAAYNIPVALRLEGTLDAAALDAAVTEIVRRHEGLRTAFATSGDGAPVQRVGPAAPITLPVIDLRGLPAPEPEARRLAAAEARQPFDLERGPLFRAVRVEVGEGVQDLLVTMHHIVSDGWSMGVLVRELTALYAAFAAGRPSPLPELPVQPADFAVWQRRWLAGAVLEEEIAHWRERLAGAPPSLDLPTDRPRPAVQTFRGASLPFLLPAQLSSTLRSFAQERGATLFMVLLAAFQALLARLSGQDDVSVGTPVAGRTHLHTEGLIGFFVNTLVLRARLEGEPGFGELLAQVRETTLAAYAHQDVPFESLVEALHPERDLGRTPLFQVMLALQNAPPGALELPGLRLEGLPVDTGTAKFELTLTLAEGAGGLGGTAELNRDLFDAATIQRLLDQFAVLLDGAVVEPGLPFTTLPLLGPGERWQILGEWSETAAPSPPRRTIHELFAEQAVRAPEAVAVVQGEARLTYRELDERSSRLAGLLRGLGVGPDVLVGLCAERSPEMVVGLLGILKAGGAYVPLDPSYPQERLAWMLEDTAAPVVLVQEHLRDRLPWGDETICHPEGEPCEPEGSGRADLSSAQILWVAEAPRRMTSRSRGSSTSDNLAYIVYTSGSTGRPKGVAALHRGVIRLVRGTGALDLGADEVWLHLAPLAFDASTLEIWGPLLNGGRVVLAPPHTLSLEELGRTLAEHGVTSLFLTTGLFHQMAEANLEGLRPLRKLMTGGDVLSPSLMRRAAAELPGCRVMAAYGPTENTTYTSLYPLTGPQDVGASVPIGRPIAGTQWYVVDRAGEAVPAGVAGELWTGGEGLARGYLGRPDLTAERFAPAPFGPPGGRLYRTGDLVRFRPDGAVEFLGRLDQQVKIRGFRIEPGEVETVLSAHPALREVAVAVTGKAPDRRLVAWYVAAAGEGLNAAELRRFLRQRVPGHMLPSAFVPVDALPLTPNGKVDRKALLRLGLPASGETGERPLQTAPRTPTEELLAGLFAEVLALPADRIGAEDDFFERGGHSLLAARLVSRVRQIFGVELPLRAVFESPRLAGLAAAIDGALRSGPGLQPPPLGPIPRTGPLPLSFSQQRLWFVDQLAPGNPAYNIPSAVGLHGDLDVPALAAALSEIVRRHEALRTAFGRGTDGEPVQRIQPAGPFPLPVVDLSGLPIPAVAESEARRLAAEEARRTFDLAHGPVLRASLVTLRRDERRLLVTMHHIASDGWSTQVLVRELAALYDAFVHGLPSPLPELPVQYADFADWQRRWLSGEVMEAELRHWRQRLQGVPRLGLPVDRPRPALRTPRAGATSLALSAALLDGLRTLSRRRGATLFMTLLAALQALLFRATGQEDFCVGTPVAGRNRLEVENLIGFFLNTLVLRADLSGRPSFGALLDRVRQETLAAYAHQDLPFEKLVEELSPDRDLSYSALFQVMINLLNFDDPASAPLHLRGLTLAPVESEEPGAKLDLTLVAAERQGELHLRLLYSADLFDAVTVRRLAHRLERLLEACLADPERPVPEIELLEEGERQQALVEWNDTAAPSPSLCVHELFAGQAARQPQAVALIAGDREVCYGELDRLAGGLAHRLRRLGVGPEVRVAVCLERSPEMVAAVLAVWKAGGAYLALDPDLPPERSAVLLADSGAALVLTRESLRERFAGFGGTVLCLDGEAVLEAGPSTVPVSSDNLAYVVYTSGSTGRPKGVLTPHGGVAAYLASLITAFGLGPGDRVLQLPSLVFDASLRDLFGPLAAGATVVLASQEQSRDAAALLSLVEQRKVTRLLSVVPTLLRALLAAAPREGNPIGSLKTLLLSGERLFLADCRRAWEVFGEQTEIVNQYGPTETTMTASRHRVVAEARSEALVGRPIPARRFYVLDRELRPMPVGSPGDLYIGGPGIARGYLDRPDLTAAAFLPDPFGPLGERLYATGDRVRHLADGNLELIGRADQQVKIRGLRVEPGEVEAALAAQPGVRQAVVVAAGEAADSRLVAYLVADAPELPGPAELRRLLAARLPEPMVPAAFVVLDELPLTATGKVDRRALAQRPPDRLSAAVPPRTRIELELLRLWEELLPVRPSGVRDTFFELGGHSLLAVRLMAHIEERFGRALPLAELFRGGTIEDLARALESAPQTASASPLLALRSTGALPPLFCVHPVGGGGLCYRKLAESLGPDRPFYALQARDVEPGDGPPETRVEAMAERYLQAIRDVQPRGPYLLAGWSFGGLVAFEMAHRLAQAEEEVGLLALIDSFAPGSRPDRELDETFFLVTVAGEAGLSLDPAAVEELQALAPSERLTRFAALAAQAGVLPEGAAEPTLRRLFGVHTAHRAAARAYRPGVYPGRITLLRAAEILSEDAAVLARRDPTYGWSGHTAQKLRVLSVPGNHFSIMEEPCVRRLAEALRRVEKPGDLRPRIPCQPG